MCLQNHKRYSVTQLTLKSCTNAVQLHPARNTRVLKSRKWFASSCIFIEKPVKFLTQFPRRLDTRIRRNYFDGCSWWSVQNQTLSFSHTDWVALEMYKFVQRSAPYFLHIFAVVKTHWICPWTAPTAAFSWPYFLTSFSGSLLELSAL